MSNRKPQRYVSKRERGERFLDVLEFAEYASAIGVDLGAIPAAGALTITAILYSSGSTPDSSRELAVPTNNLRESSLI
jgi:hypothetical protein